MKRFKLVMITAVLAVTLAMPSFAFAANSPAKPNNNVTQTSTSKTFNGKKVTFKATVKVKVNGKYKKCTKSFTTPSGNAGTYTFKYKGQTITYTIKKAANKTTCTGSKTYTSKNLKNKSISFNANVKSAKKSTVTYKSNSDQVKVSKNGKITVVKGAKKGTYKVTATVKALKNYKKAVKVITVTVK